MPATNDSSIQNREFALFSGAQILMREVLESAFGEAYALMLLTLGERPGTHPRALDDEERSRGQVRARII